ncbi:YihY/virulence factor BrkB family protein [Acuticoccus sp. M5D2P5]|uniref:YihY/virulence factor BrkB family protein n=1 Tax=Acuticoccus kalidii TaxID=2910977 RepID=UPI001F171375|nr:YihY/virulence factor BrkB family protein [Acuticoccus kalidii]MCF3936494.1 YihY/virulence factor BrkB family protein [Acuticoccus kalidii]
MARDVSLDDDEHGRYAENVFHIPLQGWKEIIKRTIKAISEDNLSLIAGGVTFFLLLAIFPALAAFVALYGLVSDVSTVQQHLNLLAGFVPSDGVELIGGELTRLASRSNGTLGFGFILGLLVALWSANAGVKALFAALNIVYDEREKRGFIELTLKSFAFTLAAIVGAGILLIVVVAAPAFMGRLGLSVQTELWVSILRWPILLFAVFGGIGLLFKFGASRQPPRWRWISWGTLLTAVLWVGVSAGFSFYLSNFANYDATYGTLGAVIGFMMWLYISLFVMLAGAELNAEIEHQVAIDTTSGPYKPMGMRDAIKADYLPEQ